MEHSIMERGRVVFMEKMMLIERLIRLVIGGLN
jgi:hypothetical protein